MLVTLFSVINLPASAAAPKAPLTTNFEVGSRILQGRPKTICVIEGTWADGEHLRFEAWDACSKMRVRPATIQEIGDAASLGADDKVTVRDIPPEAEVLQFSNDFSSVLIFRDKVGKVQEILIAD